MANPVDKMSEQSFTPDPLLSSGSFISDDPYQQTKPDPIRIAKSDPTPPPGFIAAGHASHGPVGRSFDLNAIPGPDPLRIAKSDPTPPPGFVAAGHASHGPVGRSFDLNAIPGPDPLLGSDEFVAAEGGSKGPETKRAKRAKKGSEDGGEKSELPAGWTITTKTRAKGATAGYVDKYYVEPVKGQRFRSKMEVKRYLETGSRKKSNASATPSKKTGVKKKEAAFRFDFENKPREVTWSLVDEDQGLWKPSIGEDQVPETTAQEWASTFELACQMK